MINYIFNSFYINLIGKLVLKIKYVFFHRIYTRNLLLQLQFSEWIRFYLIKNTDTQILDISTDDGDLEDVFFQLTKN